MSTHDYIVDNQNGANFRSDLNNALAAIVSNNSSATAPSTTYAFMMWADTANDLLKQRNAADSAWVDILTLSTGAVSNAEVADNAITLAKMAHGTDGEIITYDASGAPATVGVGTSGQVLTSNGAGSAPTMQDSAGGLYESIAIICDQKAYNTNGGTFTSGGWRTRDLNTEISDPDGIATISSNRISLSAGTYTVKWSAPAGAVKYHTSRLYNYSDNVVIEYAAAAHAQSSTYVETRSHGIATFTITSSKNITIQHRCSNTYATYGFGLPQTTDSASVSRYTIVEILKHS